MRGRATSWRKVTNSSPLGRRSFIDYKGNKPKALQRQEDEQGNLYYTVSKWGEGRGAPSPQSRDAQTSFLISDLLLDLDAYEVAGVRPHDSEDETRYINHLQTAGRRGEVAESTRELVKALNQSRLNAEKLVLHPAHPKRITDGDIVFSALRPPAKTGAVHMPSKGVSTSAKEDTEESYNIQALDSVHSPPRSSLSSQLRKSTSAPQQESMHEIKKILDYGDAVRSSAFMEEVRQANGIPEHAKQNNEQHIQWMLLRQHNSAFVASKSSRPGKANIQAAIINVQEKDGSRVVSPEDISSIRRIIFGALNNGSRLISNGTGNGNEVNVAAQIQESVSAVLDAYPKRKHLFFEALTFANNLASHPEIQDNSDFSVAIFFLRLRATAGLGYTKLMAEYLEEGVGSQALKDGGRLLKDLRSVLSSLESNISRMYDLREADTNELCSLFRILTGYRKLGPSQGESLRNLLLKAETRGNSRPHRVSVFARYIGHIGRVGGLRLLWSDWRTAQEILRDADKQGLASKKGDNYHTLITKRFKYALAHAQRRAEVFTKAGDGSFEECAAADYEMISQRREEYRPKEHSWEQVNNEEFEKMMELPYPEWLQRVQKAVA